ncbi:hypothetical protein [Streptomyces sp. NPDC048611]|uniref:hypothetical protein n=1 Tax=Streptomyces sp. NPDC048611 TaxID=3155635 RepID=UPI00341E7400
MRRPALHHPHPATTGWSHPYPTGVFDSVFYNDGGDPPASTPTPADLAARTTPPAAQPSADTPAAPDVAPTGDRASDDPRLVDMTQGRFNKIMSREHDKGRNAALRELAASAGLDPDIVDLDQVGKLIKDAHAARQAALSDEQRRAEELTERERALEARLAEAAQREAAAAQRDHESSIRAALVSLGATGDDLDDAASLMRLDADADDDAITQAAQALKARRPEMFGAPPPPKTTSMPPAPGGSPAGGPGPRQQPATKDAVNQAAKARAIAMGLRTDDAA